MGGKRASMREARWRRCSAPPTRASRGRHRGDRDRRRRRRDRRRARAAGGRGSSSLLQLRSKNLLRTSSLRSRRRVRSRSRRRVRSRSASSAPRPSRSRSRRQSRSRKARPKPAPVQPAPVEPEYVEPEPEYVEDYVEETEYVDEPAPEHSRRGRAGRGLPDRGRGEARAGPAARAPPQHLITRPPTFHFGRENPDSSRNIPLPRVHGAMLRSSESAAPGSTRLTHGRGQIEGVEFIASHRHPVAPDFQRRRHDRHRHRAAAASAPAPTPPVTARAYEAQDGSARLKGSDMSSSPRGRGRHRDGAAPRGRQVARELGALTVGIVPSRSPSRCPPHGPGRGGRRRPRSEVDTLIVSPTRALTVLERRTSIVDAFAVATTSCARRCRGSPTW